MHVGGLAGRQPPHHIVGDAGAQHLALRVLHDHRGAAELAEPDGAGPFDGPGTGFTAGEHQHQRGLAGAVGAGHGEVLTGFHAQRHRAEGLVVGLGVAESDVVQPSRHRGDRFGVGRRMQLVHVGNPDQSAHHPRQRPPADEGDDDDGQHRRAEEQVRPVIQRGREVMFEPLGDGLHVGDAGDHGGQPVDVGRHRVEHQVPQPRQDRKGRHRAEAEQGGRDERRTEYRRFATAPALDDAGQTADIGAVDDGHESTHARDQKCDDAACHGRGDQHSKPVPVREQAHRHGAEQRHARSERNDDGDDRGGRAQRRHHRGLRELDRLKRACPSWGARLGRGHLTILPAPRERPHHHAVTGDTGAYVGMYSKPM